MTAKSKTLLIFGGFLMDIILYWHITAEEDKEKNKKKKLCIMFEGYSCLLESYGFRLQFLWSKAAVSVLENMFLFFFFVSIKRRWIELSNKRRKNNHQNILHDLWTIHDK